MNKTILHTRNIQRIQKASVFQETKKLFIQVFLIVLFLVVCSYLLALWNPLNLPFYK